MRTYQKKSPKFLCVPSQVITERSTKLENVGSKKFVTKFPTKKHISAVPSCFGFSRTRNLKVNQVFGPSRKKNWTDLVFEKLLVQPSKSSFGSQPL